MTQDLLGKPVSELLGDDVKILSDGNVTGTLKYVDNYTEFSTVLDEQKGNYLPITLKETGTKMTIKKNGAEQPSKTDIAFDKDIVLRIPDTNTTFTIIVDSKEVITLKFTKATLKKE